MSKSSNKATSQSIGPIPKLGRKSLQEKPPRADDFARIALDLFAERSFESVSIKDIGRAADVNSAMIYYYFDSKEDLFRAAIESAVDEAFAVFDTLRAKHENPADIISDWLDTHRTLYNPLRKMVKISLDCNSVAKNAPTMDMPIKRFYQYESEILQATIKEGIKQKIFHTVDASSVAVMISTFLDGVMVRSIITERFDIATVIENFKGTLWMQLGYHAEKTRSRKKKAK